VSPRPAPPGCLVLTNPRRSCPAPGPARRRPVAEGRSRRTRWRRRPAAICRPGWPPAAGRTRAPAGPAATEPRVRHVHRTFPTVTTRCQHAATQSAVWAPWPAGRRETAGGRDRFVPPLRQDLVEPGGGGDLAGPSRRRAHGCQVGLEPSRPGADVPYVGAEA